MSSPPNVPNLEGLTDLAIRTGVDIRPTLLRVLTDLYVQKATHTPDDERHYTELALRLIDDVDEQTRTAVAQRLAEHPSSPPAVVRRLSETSDDIAALLARQRPDTLGDRSLTATAPPARELQVAHDMASSSPTPARGNPPAQNTGLAKPNPNVAELSEMFFATSAAERRLILTNLEFVGPPASRSPSARERIASYLLEAAALAHDDDEFVQQIGRSLRVGRELALRIIRDRSGEPLVVTAMALRMPRDVLERILLFLNPAIGHSVERVHGLAKLYDQIAPQAADHLVAIWRSIDPAQPAETPHRPLYWDDDTRRARSGPADARRSSPASATGVTERRGAR